ncbi:unnamed protein product [Ranitomeya imitator]|uniref:MROH2B-like N-terminal HEAT-repeats domain-containing protein n=1 Tax=Ranitomeya imitator TaxID=111125 RepID=A0ABN9LEL5_9NEOB|nr:unnamed protein product [Ranitomeya imitator]
MHRTHRRTLLLSVKDVIFEWQQAASNVLVAVGRRFINSVMEEILVKFQPGILPHFFVMQTLANLSLANARPPGQIGDKMCYPEKAAF